ncbi:NUDIX domain-containing protein [Candidatus Bathyarchaeota archaeon]|nr:NUDIX domain-containing protein [Candidatus Bathyarchaeota archaeon]
METVDCVSLIVVDGCSVLVERRRLDRETYPGCVAIPGGHVEDGETYAEACRRELKEELGLECDEFMFVAEVKVPTDVEVQNTRWYLCRGWQGEPRCYEADEVFWLNGDELDRLDLESDRGVVSRLLGA